MKIHHIGYLIKNIEDAVKEFENLGYKIYSEISYDCYRDIDICFIEKDGYLVELISPKSEKSIVYNLLRKMGNTPYHICYTSENIEKDIAELRERGYIIIGKDGVNDLLPAPCIGENVSVIFLYNKFIGIIELLKQ